MSQEVLDFILPLVASLLGFGITAIYGFFTNGFLGAFGSLLIQSILLILLVPCGLVTLFLASKFLDISYGNVFAAILKLSAIFVAWSSIYLLFYMFEWYLSAWIISAVIMITLIALFFDIEPVDVMWSFIILVVMEFIVTRIFLIWLIVTISSSRRDF